MDVLFLLFSYYGSCCYKHLSANSPVDMYNFYKVMIYSVYIYPYDRYLGYQCWRYVTFSIFIVNHKSFILLLKLVWVQYVWSFLMFGWSIVFGLVVSIIIFSLYDICSSVFLYTSPVKFLPINTISSMCFHLSSFTPISLLLVFNE